MLLNFLAVSNLQKSAAWAVWRGGVWVCRLVNIHSSFILLRGYSCGCDETARNQLPADSTLLFPRHLQDAVRFWSPMEQLWWLLSFCLIEAATFKVSSGTRAIPDEQGKAEKLQGSLKKSFRSVCCARVHSGFGLPDWFPYARSEGMHLWCIHLQMTVLMQVKEPYI